MAADPFERFLRGDADWFLQTPEGRHEFAPGPAVLFPGSFNPLHQGHTSLAELATRRLGLPVAFELSIANPDKPELDREEIRRRLEQFRGRAAVYVSRASYFARKAQLFPGTVFVVGADTAARVVHPRYYGDNPAAMDQSLAVIRSHGCRFFVGGRIDCDGRFIEMGGVAVPDSHRDLFQGVPEEEFRVDVSSTELRNRKSTTDYTEDTYKYR
jgi:hypothetical protein